nr:helicase-related protein [Escherichia coli]
MRANVDILTLTATPIPRTLNMAMSGMRDLSIIATPPARRLAVKPLSVSMTAWWSARRFLREILRGGQVYYLYNDVENIQKAAERLAELVPEARIAIGHGQMRERELERVMNDFHHQRFNVLVCTTIIEPGSTSRQPTPLSLNARITSVWRNCTSYAVASDVRIIRHMHGC